METRPVIPVVEPRFPARIGMMLAQPRQALLRVDVRGGGVRDAFWLVLAGLLCFRLEDLARAVMAISHLSFTSVLTRTLAVVSAELREAVVIVVAAALVITLVAGRGRRDPSRDLELGASCYVPFFAVRALYRVLDLEALLGPLPAVANTAAAALALLAAGVMLALAVGVARARPLEEPLTTATAGPREVPPSALDPSTGARVAVTGLAGVLGAAMAINAGWVVRHGDAISPLTQGGEAPDFLLPRIDGEAGHIGLTALRGKVVLLDFWATWCMPCVRMMPTLHGLYQEWQPRGVEFVGINADGSGARPEDVTVFLKQRPRSYPMVIDGDGSVQGMYKVVALPHLVLVGRDGTVRKAFWGMTSKSEISEALAKAAAVP
jgi:cytochrome c biogenesis protein CcmG, thiol:disulfide interchange protein DsbE